MEISREISREIKQRARDIPAFKLCKNRLQRRFLVAYALTGSITDAAKEVGCDPRNHYWWRDKHPEYVQAFEQAGEMATDVLESDMMRRSLSGYDEPVTHKGIITGYYKKFSVEERKFMLAGRKAQYRSNFQVNQFAGPVQLNVKLAGEMVQGSIAPATSEAKDITELPQSGE